MRPLLFLFGYKRMRVRSEHCERLLELCAERGVVWRDMRRGEEYCEFTCSYLTAARLLPLCEGRDIEIETVKSMGIPALFGRYRRRYGLLLLRPGSAVLAGVLPRHEQRTARQSE